jgi:O-antigen ligase
MTDSPRLRFRILASLVGVAAPCMVFGKTGVAVPVLLALLLAVPDLIHGQVWRGLGRRANTPLGWAVIATAVLWLPGVLFSIRPELSFEAWARTWLFVVAAVLFWEILARIEGGQSLALRAFTVAVAATLVISAVGFAVPEFLSLVHATGWNPRNPALVLKAFAASAMLMIPVALWAGVHLGGRWRALVTIEGFGLLWLLVATENRASMAGLLAMLAATGIVMVLRQRSRRTVIAVGLSIAAAATAVLGWMYTIPHSPWTPNLLRSLNSWAPVWLIDLPRQEIWAFTWKKFLESPWVGHGINAVNYLPGADQNIPGMGSLLTYIPGHPHNWALEVLAETGVFGFSALVVTAALLFGRLFVMYRRTHDPAFLAGLCVHLGYWVSGLFNFSFWSAWWQVSYVLLLVLSYPGRLDPASQQTQAEETTGAASGKAAIQAY